MPADVVRRLQTFSSRKTNSTLGAVCRENGSNFCIWPSWYRSLSLFLSLSIYIYMYACIYNVCICVSLCKNMKI
ncbi:hypothetical protein HanIR_Chr05g0248281 [Helianthus annuus]|nr:hypothetical protein HanIR_Chr05g0248281 [Helianthus annuus]